MSDNNNMNAKTIKPTAEQLFEAATTGQYPSGTNTRELADAYDTNGRTALHEAAKHGHLPPGTTVQDLARAKNNEDWSALHEAASEGHLPAGTTARDLASVATHSGWTALHEAAQHKHLPEGTTVKDLANVHNSNEETALHYAAESGCLPEGTTAKDLASVKDFFDKTALHTAAKQGNLPNGTTTKELASVKDRDGKTALHDACWSACMPPETTAQDLVYARDNRGKRASEGLTPGEIPDILKITKAADHKELKLIGEVLQKTNPIAVAVWATAEMQRLNEKGRYAEQSKTVEATKNKETVNPKLLKYAKADEAVAVGGSPLALETARVARSQAIIDVLAEKLPAWTLQPYGKTGDVWALNPANSNPFDNADTLRAAGVKSYGVAGPAMVVRSLEYQSQEAVKTQEQAKPASMLEEIISQRRTSTPASDQQGKDLGGR